MIFKWTSERVLRIKSAKSVTRDYIPTYTFVAVNEGMSGQHYTRDITAVQSQLMQARLELGEYTYVN